MEISKLNVRDLTQEEMLRIDGGRPLKEILGNIWEAIKEAAEWIWEQILTEYNNIAERKDLPAIPFI